MDDPDHVFSSLGDLFSREAVQEAKERIRDTTPFKVVTITIISICF